PAEMGWKVGCADSIGVEPPVAVSDVAELSLLLPPQALSAMASAATAAAIRGLRDMGSPLS
ncbi:MAG: hypothetical protein RL573_527, partial [Actinomycetota bacterium]